MADVLRLLHELLHHPDERIRFRAAVLIWEKTHG